MPNAIMWILIGVLCVSLVAFDVFIWGLVFEIDQGEIGTLYKKGRDGSIKIIRTVLPGWHLRWPTEKLFLMDGLFLSGHVVVGTKGKSSTVRFIIAQYGCALLPHDGLLVECIRNGVGVMRQRAEPIVEKLIRRTIERTLETHPAEEILSANALEDFNLFASETMGSLALSIMAIKLSVEKF